jgi:hypothetical protein
MSGGIGTRKRQMVWEWYETEYVYSEKGSKYLKLMCNFEKQPT